MSKLSTLEIMQLDEKALVARLKEMHVDELETHARDLMLELGGEDYGSVMKHVMKTLETPPNDIDRFSLIQNTLREALPNKAIMSDIYQRLASIVLLIIAMRYKSLLQSR